MLKKNEIILKKVYDDILENTNFVCEKMYLEIYGFDSSKGKITTQEELLKVVFAYLHSTINGVFDRINSRLKKDNFHLLAGDNRTLIQICDIFDDLSLNLKNTSLSFSIDKKYLTILAEIKPYLQFTNGSTLPSNFKTINISKYDPIFLFTNYVANIENIDDFNSLIQKISLNKDVDFYCLNYDEQLSLLNNAIENILKENKKFKSININKFCEIIDESTIKKFRVKTQCFRHASNESLLEREKFSLQQKLFLINFGLSIIDALLH